MRDSNRFQNGSLTLVKNKKADDSWFFRYYEDVAGKRVHRNLRIGTVRELPRRREAEKAVMSLRSTINSGARSPATVSDLVAHYRKHELTLEHKAYATVEAHESYLALHILPKWQDHKLSEVKTVAVEQWLDSMDLAPPPRPKSATSCLRSTVMAFGTSGFHSTRSAKFAARQRDCVNLTCSHLRSSRHYCGNFPCVSVPLSCLRVRPAFVDPSCSHSGGAMSTSSPWKLPLLVHACAITSETRRRKRAASLYRCTIRSLKSWRNGGAHHCTRVMRTFSSLPSA